MARIDRFMVAPISTGLQTDVRPWLIPDDAFASLNNAYVFRGRVRKRFGAKLMRGSVGATDGYESLQSRLRIKIATTDGIGGAVGIVPGIIFQIGQSFSIGDQIYTVNATGIPATMLNTGAGSGTYNTTTGAYVFIGAAALTDVYFYPAQPVMGLINLESSAISDEPIFAFDTQFAYQFTVSGWARLGTAVWTGGNADFFWGYNWRGISSADTYLFVTNYFSGADLSDSDVMKYWNGSVWTNLNPRFSSTVATNTIVTARIIVPFKDRLVLLNVVENTGIAPGVNATYVNRCRFSWNGSPVDSTAFYEDVPGKGGYLDAPTKEAIITAQFLKDRLIVYFESSTWELVYTGNEILPFRWQQINTELGAESTFSQVPFDKIVLGVGNVGIHACNGSNVERIDEKIPNSVFDIHNENNGVQRVAGIRDYYVEMVYWSFPGIDRSTDFPFNNKVLIYNYKTGSWAFNDDSITAFGYYQAAADEGETWASYPNTWEESIESWKQAPLQAKFRSVLAGNQEGFVFIISPDLSTNCQALSITDATTTGTFTVINHNFEVGDFIKIVNMQGIVDYNDSIFKITQVVDRDTFIITIPTGLIPTGTYTGAGTIVRISIIDIQTKQYNFYVQDGRNAYISKTDFLVDKTSSGEISVDYFVSTSTESMVQEASITGALLGTSVLETKPYSNVALEQNQTRLWHPVYLSAEGECIQLRLYFNDDQAVDTDIVESDFELHAMTFYVTPTTSRLQ